MSILTVQHLEKHFENTKVLNDISFSLEEGQALSIIGSSGSGKTTLLRCLNFLETPDAGTITVQDKVLFDADHHANCSEKEIRKNRLHFGMVFQSFNLFPQYTALENVTLARELMAKDTGESKDAIRAAGMELLDQMGLADRAGHYPHQLSGGQQQRVAIARALALHPDILCFDEPTSALDPELTGEVLKVIRGLAEQKTTMIIVTHEMAFARDVADQVIFMDGGFIVEQGDPKQVIDHPQEERTKQFLARFHDPENMVVAAEFGIGLNTHSRCAGNCYIEDESTYGTFHIGFGRNIALGGVQDASGHYDLVTHAPCIYVDNRMIMDHGQLTVLEPSIYI